MQTWLSIARALALGVIAAGVLHADGVRNLNQPQSPSYPTVQAAINEAGEGDVLLVAPGIYPAFTLDGKGLSIVAVESGTALIMDAVTIRNTTTPVWLCGLRIEDDLLNGYVGPVDPGFALENCSGGIRLQDITVVMRRTRTTHITNSSKIATTHSAFVSLRENSMHSEGALTMDGSTLLLHESRVRGSDGFLEEVGTAGLVARNSVLFCAGSHLYGGDGGGADDGDCGEPGDSGLKAPGALVLDNTYHGGAWGPGFIGSCTLPPAPAFIPPLRELAGRNRSLEASPLLADTAVIAVSVRGVPGDRVWLFEAAQTAFDLDLARNGWWLIPQPGSPSPNPDGIIPPSGVLTLQRNLPLVSPAIPVERLELQALVEDAQGAEYLTNARQVWRLSHRSLPDCDGDGLQDFVAVLGGLVLDVDDDLIPDTCALGPQTWFVDASAAPLGTGEPQRPFRDIASGVAKARAGDTVIVADGNYTGPGNRNLNFFGRDLILRSANGPLGCVIDCENLGRALVATHNESLSSLVQGFTIRRGNTEAAQTQNSHDGGGIFVIDCALTVRDCRIENCYASRSGGGVYAGYGELILEHCVMVSNSADSGGGLQIERGSVLVSQTDFEFGRSHFGAGVALDLGSDDVLHAQFSACTLRGNVAVNKAGGVFVIAREQNPAQFESCLFIGNRAPRGSALLTEFGNLELRDCTIAQNQSSASSATVVLVDYPFSPLYTPFNVLRNTIVWSNYPLGGTAIRVEHEGQLDIDFCAVEGGAAAIVHPVAWPPIVGANVFDVDPRFQNPNGPDGNPLTLVDNDLRLALDSPCIDAGDNAAISADWADLDGDGDRLEPTPFDLQRRRRRLDVPAVPDTGVGAPPLVDFGCYERSASRP